MEQNPEIQVKILQQKMEALDRLLNPPWYIELYRKPLRKLKGFFYSLYNIARWAPLLYHDREWDHTYFYQIIHKKLGYMEKYFQKSQISMDNRRNYERIKICRILLGRIIDGTTQDMLTDRILKMQSQYFDIQHDETPDERGRYSMHFYRATKVEKLKVKHYRKLSKGCEELELELLCKYIQKYSRGWWD